VFFFFFFFQSRFFILKGSRYWKGTRKGIHIVHGFQASQAELLEIVEQEIPPSFTI